MPSTPPLEPWPLGRDLTRRLREISARHCTAEGGSHGPEHSERVHLTALRIGRGEGADLRIVSAAALLHDIGRRAESESQGRVCHAACGADMAVEILADLGLDPDFAAAVAACIRSHRFRRPPAPRAIEDKVLFDADKLDSIGAVGIGRAFLFAGRIGARLHNGLIDVERTKAYGPEDTAYREFVVKMRRVPGCLLTATGRELARGRLEFMEEFFQRLNKEIYGAPRPLEAGLTGEEGWLSSW